MSKIVEETRTAGEWFTIYASAYERAARRALVSSADMLEFANWEEYNGHPETAAVVRQQAFQASRQATANFRWARFYANQ